MFALLARMVWRTRGISNRRAQKSLRKKLRNSTTSAEAILWTCLQGRKLLGKKFRRQVGIGRYIVDFYCPECRLAIELDGAPHFAPNVEEQEAQRTKYLEALGIKVIRFENRAVHRDIEFVLEIIRENLRQRIPPN
jgi:very-short-patch-repair endonuclease